MSITDHERALLEAGYLRHQAIDVLHRAGQADAKRLQSLIGQRCKAHGNVYEIRDVHYGYNGFIKASGYRILKSGERGQRGRWEIGALTSRNFEDV